MNQIHLLWLPTATSLAVGNITVTKSQTHTYYKQSVSNVKKKKQVQIYPGVDRVQPSNRYFEAEVQGMNLGI